MELSPREKHILQVMLDGEGIMYVKEIAEKLKVSRRTVLRELNNIGANLIDFNISLEKRQGQGIWLQGNQGDKEKLRKILENTDLVDYTDKELRRKYIICELLKTKEPQKLYYFSHTMAVSDGTVSSDLEGVAEWFYDTGVKLIRRHGYGINLQGREKEIRKAVKKLFSEEVSNDELNKLISNNNEAYRESLSLNDSARGIYSLISPHTLITIAEVLQNIVNPKLRLMTDISYFAIIVHISVAVTRILSGNSIKESIEELRPEEDYLVTEEIILALERKFNIKLSKGEYAYIFMEIRGAKLKLPKEESRINLDISYDKIPDLVDSMIDAFDESLAFNLKYDHDFITGLICHLEPTMYRLSRDMMIYNPMLSEIKMHYQDCFEKSRRVARVLEDFLGVAVNDHEVGYLAIHFGAALERMKSASELDRKLDVGIVCESGIGLARLMQVKLESYLKKEANLYVFSREDIDRETREKVDFFISSINLEDLEVDYISVSPFLSEEDYKNIKSKMKACSRKAKKQQKRRSLRNTEEINYIALQIDAILNKFELIKVNEAISFNGLTEYICDTIAVNKEKAAIIYRDIQARERLLTQIFEEERFALLHCRTKGVSNSSFYIFNPEQGESFTDSYMKGIRSVIVMLMPESQHNDINMKLLGSVSSSLISDESFLSNIFQGNELVIRNQLGDILGDYFERFLNQ
ncbi:PRD domain-containing protein [Alloiococcus sp. CFN-8]|uniref:PRD domain-containing protein n=1 Tax=Alloiococcus sp. CFN-8 TaxID=3416081 RepID=UPI003CF8A9DE